MSVNPGSLTDSSKITLQIGDEKLSGFSGLQVSLGIDTASNAFAFSVPWTPTLENIKRFKPFSPKIVRVRIDDQIILTGYLELTGWGLSENSDEVTIQGRSASAPIVDYSAGPPFQFQNITFNDFGREMWKSVGGDVDVYTETIIDYTEEGRRELVQLEKINGGTVVYTNPDTARISEISFDPGKKLYEIVSNLGSAHGLWAVPDSLGRLEYRKISSTQQSVAVLEEGKGPVRSVTTNHDLTKRFQRYMVVGAFDGKDATAEVSDPESFGLAKRGRLITPLNQQTTDINQAAIFSRSKALIDSYSANCEVEGWHYNGNLWQPGTILTLKAPGAYINYASRLMIKNVTLQLDGNGGQITGLDLSLPEAWDLTQPKLESLPWRE